MKLYHLMPFYNQIMKIILKNISKSYSHKEIFTDLSFEIDPACIVTVTGKNGSGKTTLLKIIVGLAKQNHGNVFYEYEGKRISYESVKKHIGFSSNNELLIEALTGMNYLFFIRKIYRIPKDKFENNLHSLLNRFGINSEVLYQPIATYSTGFKKIIEIFGVLIHDPDLIILDEPFSGLDLNIKTILINYLVDLKKANKTIIVATHDSEFVDSYSNKTIVI